jgi:hypothetical protein
MNGVLEWYGERRRQGCQHLRIGKGILTFTGGNKETVYTLHHRHFHQL